jgi:hypothetical protein
MVLSILKLRQENRPRDRWHFTTGGRRTHAAFASAGRFTRVSRGWGGVRPHVAIQKAPRGAAGP